MFRPNSPTYSSTVLEELTWLAKLEYGLSEVITKLNASREKHFGLRRVRPRPEYHMLENAKAP